MTWSHSSGVILRTVLSTVMPALLTRMSSCPCRSRTSPMTRTQSSLEPILPWWIVTPWSAYLSANSWAASRLDEYPAATCTPRFISRSQMASPIPRIPPVTRATCPFMSAMVVTSVRCSYGWAERPRSAEHVLPGGVRDGRVLPAAHVRRVYERARAGLGPGGPVLPPRAALLAVGRAPGLGVAARAVGRLVPGLRAGRVDDAGDVAAAGEHVADLATHQPARLVRAVPGHDVVVDRADHIRVVLHRGQRQPLAGQLELAPGQLVAHVQRAQVERVHRGWHAGAIAVPGQDVERGRILAHQPVGDHVVEDQ